MTTRSTTVTLAGRRPATGGRSPSKKSHTQRKSPNSSKKTSTEEESNNLEPLDAEQIDDNENRLDKYRLLSVISSGSFGTVRKAKNMLKNQMVAIKKVSKDHEKLFHKEITVLRHVRGNSCHHFLLCAYESFLIGENYYLVTEFIDGEPLNKFIEHNDLTAEENYGLILQISEAIKVIHDLKIGHRDLKPANIMVYRDFTGEIKVKIIDFGLACIISKKSNAVCSTNRVGTRKYMAPEVIRREVKSPEQVKPTDIYSLASIYYHIASGGDPLFTGNGDNEELERKILNNLHAPLGVIPAYLRPVIKSMLSSADERPDIDEVISDLESSYGDYVEDGLSANIATDADTSQDEGSDGDDTNSDANNDEKVADSDEE